MDDRLHVVGVIDCFGAFMVYNCINSFPVVDRVDISLYIFIRYFSADDLLVKCFPLFTILLLISADLNLCSVIALSPDIA